MTQVAPFDAAAESYDVDFTDTQLGQWLRDIVHAHLPVCSGDLILELGCGTGDDAIWLAQNGAQVIATDVSQRMLDVAQSKSSGLSLDNPPTFEQLDINNTSVPRQWDSRRFDGVLSNFGVINCVQDLSALASFVAQHTKPGAWIVFVTMNRLCAWEIIWHITHFDFAQAFRRFNEVQDAHVGDDHHIPVRYPYTSQIKHAFQPWFVHEKTRGIGTLLPPSYLNHLVHRYDGVFHQFARFDRSVGAQWPLRIFSDHVLILLRRR